MFFYSDLSDSDHWKYSLLTHQNSECPELQYYKWVCHFSKWQTEVIVGNSAQEECLSSVLWNKTVYSEDLRWRIVSLIHIYDIEISFSAIFLVQIFAAYNDDMQSSSRFHRKSHVIKMGWFQYYLNKLCNKVWIKLQIDNYILSFELYLCQTKIYLWFEFLYSISNMFQKSFLN